MTNHGLAQAAELLLVYLTARSVGSIRDQLSIFFNLIYHDALNREPIDRTNITSTVQDVCDRFGDIIVDHITLETILLDIASRATGQAPDAILRDIARRSRDENG
jgi:hypothetical protein